MTEVFVDTLFFVAWLNPNDQWHKKAVELEANLVNSNLITSESVLIELLNFFANFPPQMREATAKIAHRCLQNFEIETIRHSTLDFENGLKLYANRLDKGYSLTDCISMNLMRERGITQVLTHDNHFEQESFEAMFRKEL